MEGIIIGGNKNKCEVKDLIDSHFHNSKVEIQEKDYENRFEFYFSLGKKKSVDDAAYYNKIANLVQDIILKVYIEKVIKDRVAKICSDYSLSEKEEIIVSTQYTLMNKACFYEEKDIIINEMIDYLIENKALLIDGYMQFRLKKFLYIIDIAIEKSISEIESEKEYLEFLNMLQYFVDIQETKANIINVIIQEEDYILLDENNNKIEDLLVNSMKEDLAYDDVSKADLLISSLIILSPERLIMHINESGNKELINVISQVFGEKVELCNGCEKCKAKAKLKKGK